MFECGKCGTSIGDYEVHTDKVCTSQRETNSINTRGSLPCKWCYSPFPPHKKGCPRHKPDVHSI
jgi:hypothetical protein